MALLEAANLSVRYGAVRAVEDVSIRIEPGEIVALIGANGAGKSSTLRAIAGIVRLSSGVVHTLSTKRTSGRSANWIAKRCRFSYVPEDRGIFTRMSVLENVELGAYSRRREGRAWLDSRLRYVFGFFPVLEERQTQLAGTLSGGEQQMLAIGRALVSEPRLLLLDEPSLGLAPKIVTGIFEQFDQIRRDGTSILVVEQNSRMALRVSNRAYVMERGRVVIEGLSADLAKDDRVRRAYLGLGTAA